MKRKYLLMAACLLGIGTSAQPPSRLTTDLLEHTDRVFLDGRPSTVTLQELRRTIERRQLAEIRMEKPALGWVVNGVRPNTVQTAYRILVASSPELLKEGAADMWDSGCVDSDNSVAVAYNGKALQPSTVYYWTVKTWDNHGVESRYANPKGFRTAAKLDNGTAVYPLQVTDERPVSIQRNSKGAAFMDFGKDAFGNLRVTLTSCSRNDTVTIHIGERCKGTSVDRKPGASIRHSSYRLPIMQGTHVCREDTYRQEKRAGKARGGADAGIYRRSDTVPLLRDRELCGRVDTG